MNTVKKVSGIALATAAAAMFVAAPSVSAGTTSEKGHCIGINSCKGSSDCATAESKCKGLNVCKGHGFLSTTKAECAEKGGKFEMSKK